MDAEPLTEGAEATARITVAESTARATGGVARTAAVATRQKQLQYIALRTAQQVTQFNLHETKQKIRE